MKKLSYQEILEINSIKKASINKSIADFFGSPTVQQAKEYYEKYTIPTLGSERFKFDYETKKIIHSYIDQPTKGIKRYLTEDEFEKLKKICSSKLKLIKRRLTYIVMYESTCSQWGSYNPHCYLRLEKLYRIDQDTLVTYKDIEHLNHGSRPDYSKSQYYQTDKSMYKDAIVEKRSIKYKGLILKDCKVLYIGKESFHGNFDATNAILYKSLLHKKALRTKKAAETRKLKKLKGQKITKSFLKAEFGFCEIGIDDWAGWVGIDNNIAYADDIIHAYKNASKDVKIYLRENYGSETAQILLFCRQIIKGLKKGKKTNTKGCKS